MEPAAPPAAWWKRHIIGQGFRMGIADFDADGDIDVVVGEHRTPDKTSRVVLFETPTALPEAAQK